MFVVREDLEDDDSSPMVLGIEREGMLIWDRPLLGLNNKLVVSLEDIYSNRKPISLLVVDGIEGNRFPLFHCPTDSKL